jgi:hypothetical protein
MTTYDLDRMVDEWMSSADAITEPATLLPSVFDVTRNATQRRGLRGRIRLAVASAGGASAWSVRPLVTYTILILLLVAMTFAVTFAAGFLRPPPHAGWRPLDTDDAATTYVSRITSMPNAFVAIGSSQVVDADCATGEERGRVWTSTDGDRWVDRSNETFRKLQPQDLFTAGDWIYLIARDVVCYDEDGDGEQGEIHVLRSRDGVSWDVLPPSDEMFQWGNVPLVAESDDELVAIGPYQELLGSGEYADDKPTVWSSPDGVNWERRATLEGARHITGLAARDGVVVALGLDDRSGVVILTSTDGGQTWTPQDVPDSVPGSLAFLVAGDGRFVAAGDDAAIVSEDGITWTAATADAGYLNGVNGLLAVPGGYLVTREDRADDATVDVCREVVGPPRPVPSDGSQHVEFTPNPSPLMTCVPEALGGGTSFSRDGLEWTSGPDLPRSEQTVASGGFYIVAVGQHGIVASDSSRPAELWYSPLSPFLTSD